VKLRRVLAVALAAAPVAVLPGGDRLAAAAPMSGYRILLTSNRDGQFRGYSVRSDGSRLTPLLPRGRHMLPAAISADGRVVAYTSGDFTRPVSVYVSRASGAGLRRIGLGGEPALSRDGRLLAYAVRAGITIVGTSRRGRRLIPSPTGEVPSWSPDAKSIVFAEQIHEDPDRYSVVLKPLRGPRRVIFRTGPADAACLTSILQPTWSPDGRWVAYVNCEDDRRLDGLWVVRPDGTGRHRLAPADTFAWSPDAKALTYSADGNVGVVGVDGRGRRRLRLPSLNVLAPLWAPGGHGLVLRAQSGDDDPQIWTVGLDGRGLRRVTSSGRNGLVGWTRVAPAQPPAKPLPRTERVRGADTLSVRSPVGGLSADGGRVAFVATRTKTDCDHVSVWTPAAKSVRRFRLPSPCLISQSFSSGISDLALAGSRAAWVSYAGGEGECDFTLESATLGRPLPLALNSNPVGGCSPFFDFHLRGDGGVLVFDDGERLTRIGTGGEKCEESEPAPLTTSICATVRRGEHASPVEAVAGNLIAVREPDAVAVLDAQGNLVRLFPFAVGAARLDGGKLVVVRASTLEVYDVAGAALEVSRPLPDGYALADVDGGIAVLLRDRTIMLLRLDDGRSLTLTPGAGPVLADLEPPGLYYSFATGDGGGRVVFLPRPSLLR
jgi:Tol biopolymer transport system component